MTELRNRIQILNWRGYGAEESSVSYYAFSSEDPGDIHEMIQAEHDVIFGQEGGSGAYSDDDITIEDGDIINGFVISISPVDGKESERRKPFTVVGRFPEEDGGGQHFFKVWAVDRDEACKFAQISARAERDVEDTTYNILGDDESLVVIAGHGVEVI